MRRKLILFLILFAGSNFFIVEAKTSSSTDTITINLQNAENQFLTNNLLLLAERYNVDATRALILQAKLYPNPSFSYTNTIYNSSNNNKYFDQSAKSDPAPQITQLILLAGKIKKQVKIAETNYKIAEDNLFDLLRTLKLALRSSFFNIYYLQKTAKVYYEEINNLKLIVTAYNREQVKGYVSEADVIRIQAQLYSLQAEYQTLIDNINDLESQLRLLLHSSSDTFLRPDVDSTIVKANPHVYSLNTLLDSAYVNRTDLMIARDNLLLSHQNYSLQKALAVPDITFGPGFVKQSNFIQNDLTYVIGFSLPLFNRNQGNIKNARILIDYNNTQLEFAHKNLEEQVIRGLQKAEDADNLYKGIDPAFAGKFDKLAKEMIQLYMKRNISLLDFLNFYDSYKQNIVQLNTISFNKVNALENMNFLTGTAFFNNK
jgi:cobalt-zinc-cadmium efflux system outer membrane protein